MTEPEFAYLTTTGRVSGRQHEIGIWFVRTGDAVHLLAGNREHSDWVANLQADPRISIRIAEVTYTGVARIESGGSKASRKALRLKYATPSDDLAEWSRESLPVRVEITATATPL
jgi:deazaflavin-dependent oxidoreductase (nitroreductase family)